MTDDTQKIWTDYYIRKRSERLAEAAQLWKLMRARGVTESTVLAVDFVHFGTSQTNVENLAKQLAENYQVTVAPAAEPGYWLANGTSRPYGITLNEQQHSDWVAFMADVAESYGCVFTNWTLEAASLSATFRSEETDGAS